jgi:hypothetical protein
MDDTVTGIPGRYITNLIDMTGVLRGRKVHFTDN